MPKYLLPLLAFILLCFLGNSLPLLDSKSDSPGWHTTIYPAYYRWVPVMVLLFLFFIIGRWLLGQKANKFDCRLFCVHFLISFTTEIFIRYPTILSKYHGLDISDDAINDLVLGVRLIPIMEWTFRVGQSLFLVYFFRNMRKKDLEPKAMIPTTG